MNQLRSMYANSRRTRAFDSKRRLPILLVLSLLLSTVLPIFTSTQLASAAGDGSTSSRMVPIFTELSAVQDARTQAGAPNQNYGDGFLWTGTPNGHYAFVEFDLSVLPADAVIETAELRLDYVNVDAGAANVEVGRVDGAWDELTLTWASQPDVTWSGVTQLVEETGIAAWDVKPVVLQWTGGTQPNYGLGLRGQDSVLQAAHSKETGVAPKLVISYNIEEDNQPRPDTGDAPDSTNHHGQDNTAYPAGPVLGQFPTVWNVPAGQVAGPRHANASAEAWLGQVISRENDADQGPDQDGPNNILRGAGGAIGDVANNDRGDDGWRNRNITFFDCQEQTLTVRVSKGQNATKQRMYLNVWFDGNRDGDWQDINPCKPDEDGPNQASYEWIVQDYIIDMTAVPAGGHLDFDINTELVYNAAEDQGHWMRFSLSEDRAIQPDDSDYPDGRGPHPDDAKPSFEFGETEDVFQKVRPQGEDGTLTIQKRVLTEAEPVGYAETVTYEILLTNEGGTQPVQAELRDLLPYPFHVLRQINDTGQVYLVDVTSPTGGASPLQADLSYQSGSGVPIQQQIEWQGVLEPNAQVKLAFDVHIHPYCAAGENTTTIQNVAQARTKGGDPVEAIAEFEAACPGYSVNDVTLSREVILEDSITRPGEVNAASSDAAFSLIPGLLDKKFRVRNVLENSSDLSMRLNIVTSWTGCLTCTVAAQSAVQVASVQEQAPDHYTGITELLLEPGEIKSFEQLVDPEDLILGSGFDARLEPINLVGDLTFCIVSDNEEGCPSAEDYPNLVQVNEPLQIEYRPADLGDAPDSTNHAAGTNMTAYAGTQGNFPTVFDPALGSPQGPLHRQPRGLHLGQRVSREVEADVGPDEDPSNNLLPAADSANRDRGDDGIRPNQLGFQGCQVSTFRASVFAHPAMLAKMQEKGLEKVYINSWIDGINDAGAAGGDGDWADEMQCPSGSAPEHIVIDHPVDVASLIGGNNVITVTTSGPVPWNGQSEAWFRISLSEVESVKLAGKPYGDGRGPATGFRTGETEDYKLYPQGAAENGPDLEIQLVGSIVNTYAADSDVLAAGSEANKNSEVRRFKLRYANLGNQIAQGGKFSITLPSILANGDIRVRAPSIDDDQIDIGSTGIEGTLPDLNPGEMGTVVLGWTGCLTCTLAAQHNLADSVLASITLPDDVNKANDSATWQLQEPVSPARVTFLDMDGNPYPYNSAMACEPPQIAGEGFEPERSLLIRTASDTVEQVTTDTAGSFVHQLELGDGKHKIQVSVGDEVSAALHNASELGIRCPLTSVDCIMAFDLWIDSGWTIDPMSMSFTDESGLVTKPSPSFFQTGGSNVTLPGLGRYTVNASSCSSADVRSIGYTVGEQYFRAVQNGDCGSDDCGPWSAKIDIAEPVNSAAVRGDADPAQPLSMIISTGDSQQIIESAVEVAATGTVQDAATDQPLADATVTLWQVLGDSDNAALVPWNGASQGQSNPQRTDADGHYAFTGPEEAVRLTVQRAGYQPYTTADLASTGGLLEEDIQLTAEIAGEATHVVAITENGFEPAYLAVKPGSIVSFVNVDLSEHSASGSAFYSGLLLTGEEYKALFSNEGTFSYSDEVGTSQATIVVDENAPKPDDDQTENPVPTNPVDNNDLFLPIIEG